jgi:hypothetical protein
MRPMQARTVIATFGAGLTALAVGGVPAGGANHSGAYGKVFRGPIRPVCVSDLPCSAPARGVVLVFTHAERSMKTTTRRDGSYRVVLAPGTYIVSITPRRALGAGLRPHTVVVHGDTMTRRNFTIDTGIR